MHSEVSFPKAISDLRIIREPECANLTGLARVTRYVLERRGDFPKRVKLGARSAGWYEKDIRTWLESRC